LAPKDIAPNASVASGAWRRKSAAGSTRTLAGHDQGLFEVVIDAEQRCRRRCVGMFGAFGTEADQSAAPLLLKIEQKAVRAGKRQVAARVSKLSASTAAGLLGRDAGDKTVRRSLGAGAAATLH